MWTMMVCWKWGDVNGYWIHFEASANRTLMGRMKYSIQLKLSEHIIFYPSRNTLKMKTLIIYVEDTNVRGLSLDYGPPKYEEKERFKE